MSLLRGQHGSQSRQDSVPTTGEFANGNFLNPDGPGSLGVEERTRFRPQSYVAPREISLMQGSFTIPGVDSYTGEQEHRVKTSNGWFMSD